MSIPTTVVIDGSRVFLKNLLGQGSMSSVYAIELKGVKLAAKIFVYDGDPMKEAMRPIRAKKIPQMVAMDLPDTVLPPRHVITSDAGEFLGYAMPLMPKGFVPLAELYSPKFWAQNLWTPTKSLKTFVGLRKFVASLHEKGLVICDFNPGNAEFHTSRLGAVVGCDVDSYQIPGFNGCELHWAYGAPRLFNKDLSSGSFPFLPDDDWWSYYIHFVTGMTRGGHPFRGKGAWFKKACGTMEVPERILAGISIFDSRAETIGGALPIGIMPDDVLHHLQTVLVSNKKANGPMPDFVFEMKFKACPTCRNEYARNVCPVCHKVVFVPVVVPISTLEYLADVFKTSAAIVACAIIDGAVQLIVREPNQFRAIRVALDGTVVQNHPLALSVDPGESYVVAIGQTLFAVADSEFLYVFDANGKEIERTKTNTFLQQPAFGLSDTLYRTVGSVIMRWATIGGSRLYQPVVQNVPNGNTWLEACPAGVVFMTYAVGSYTFNLLQGSSRWTIPVQRITSGFHVVRQFVAASDKASVTIFRVVEDSRGSQQTLVDQYDVATKAVSSRIYAGVIDQASVMGGTILFPSDEGLNVWKKGESAPSVREGTHGKVQEGDEILLAGPGTIVVVREGAISVLKAK